MHWQHHSNPMMRDLALNNTLESYPEIEYWEEAYLSQYEALNLVFGSTPVEIRLGVFDAEARTAFVHGACIVLALALAEANGETDPHFLVVTAEDSPAGWTGHVALMVTDDTALDFHGLRGVDRVAGDYPGATSAIRDRSWVLENLVDEEYHHDPFAWLGDLERLVTHDFARIILLDAAKTFA